MQLGLFDKIKYALFPPSGMEFVIDQLPDIVLELSKNEPLICGFMICLSLGLTYIIYEPIDKIYNRSFGQQEIVEYVKNVLFFPVLLLIGPLILWLPIKIFGRVIGYMVYPLEWIASFVLGIVYTIFDFIL